MTVRELNDHENMLGKYGRSVLREHNIELVDIHSSVYTCRECGYTWIVDAPRNEVRLPRGWWKCPQGCNHNG